LTDAGRHSGLALAALLAGAACIGLSPIWVRVSEVGPTATAFWRVALAVPLLAALLPMAPPSGPAAIPWKLYAFAGAAFAGDLACWHWSIRFTSVANAALLANLAAVLVTLATWLLWRQRPTRLFVAGLVTALCGVAVLLRASLDFSPTALTGDALGIITAFFYTGYLLALKQVRDRGAPTLHVMAATTTVTALALYPVALLSGEPLLPGTTSGWLKLMGLAWLSHAAGQGLIAYAFAHLPAALSSVSLLFQPVMAAVFAWLLLGEALSPLQLVGGAVVLAGIYVARRGSAV
jgi:drug/metabolite transporter (DMT)-like permease